MVGALVRPAEELLARLAMAELLRASATASSYRGVKRPCLSRVLTAVRAPSPGCVVFTDEPVLGPGESGAAYATADRPMVLLRDRRTWRTTPELAHDDARRTAVAKDDDEVDFTTFSSYVQTWQGAAIGEKYERTRCVAATR